MTKEILRFVALCCVVTACANSQAQSERIRVTGDIAVTRMVDKHVELNQRVKTIPGYRVQIASFSGTNSKTSAFTLRDRFMTDYPEVQAYVAFDEPNTSSETTSSKTTSIPSRRRKLNTRPTTKKAKNKKEALHR